MTASPEFNRIPIPEKLLKKDEKMNLNSLMPFIMCFLLPICSWAIQFDRNVPIAVQRRIYSDLNFLYSIRGNGSTALHREIFGKVDGRDYQNYLESKLTKISFGNCGGGIAVACANPEEEGTIYLTPRFVDPSISRLIRIFTIFHEVRHLDPNFANWPHVSCPIPFVGENGKNVVGIMTGEKLAGEDACDWTFYGAYGSTSILLKNLALFCTNCSSTFRAEAHYLAYDQMKRVIDSEAYSAMLSDYIDTIPTSGN